MKEKKVTKINLSTLLLIFAIVVIIIMGMFIYKLNIEKENAIQKSVELQSQVDVLKNTVDTLQGKIDSISEIINMSKNESKKTNVTSQKDYSKYLGSWSDNNYNELIVKSIENNSITFDLSLYRITTIHDITLPLEDDKAIFYYNGYDDKNFNEKHEDDEAYFRKATLQLSENSISIKIEDISSEESSKNKSLNFDGQVYVIPWQYNFSVKN